jgi:hypothetical protein
MASRKGQGPRKVTLGGSSTKKPKANLSNKYGIKGSSGKPPTGAVTMRKAPRGQTHIPKD